MIIQVVDQSRVSQSDLNQTDGRQPGSAEDRAGLFGDGFFTTGIIENGLVLHLQKHLQRLSETGQSLKFPELDFRQLESRLLALSQSSVNSIFRITISRSQSQRGYAISPLQSVFIKIHLFPWKGAPEDQLMTFFAATPISLNSRLAGLKHLNRLDNVLAASERESENFEALMCFEDNVICGSRANLFILQQQQWLTPRLDRAGVVGITRDRLMSKAAEAGISIIERDISRYEVINAQAAFLTNSLWGLRPISTIEQKPMDLTQSNALRSVLGFTR